MKRFLVLLVLPLVLGACKKGDGVSIQINEDFQATQDGDPSNLVYEKIAVFPFLTALHLRRSRRRGSCHDGKVLRRGARRAQ